MVWLSVERIAKLLKKPVKLVRALVHEDSLETASSMMLKKRARILNQEHISFLTSQTTLRVWRPYSLRARVVLFHR